MEESDADRSGDHKDGFFHFESRNSSKSKNRPENKVTSLAESKPAITTRTSEQRCPTCGAISGAEDPLSSPYSSPYSYPMTRPYRGRCVVFNNKKFDPDTELSYRTGSDVDAKSVRSTFSVLGFTVRVHTDRSADQMREIVRDVSLEDHTDSDCLAVVVLSHGSEGVVYGRDKILFIEDLVAPLKGDNCPSLVGKPKLFFVQACRGERFDDGADIVEQAEGFDETDSKSARLPQEADLLYAFSTVSGYFSWRSGGSGPYFIQALCDALDELSASMDLVHILTRVNHRVATEFESRVTSKPDQHKKRQMPSVVSMLTKDLYLAPRHTVSPV